jgi:hypothetical protein
VGSRRMVDTILRHYKPVTAAVRRGALTDPSGLPTFVTSRVDSIRVHYAVKR